MFVHDSALVEEGAHIGAGAKVWHHCHVRKGAKIGDDAVLGRGVFVDAEVQIGRASKLQNYVCVFHGVSIGRGVFVGPHACFTNDLVPRAANPDLSLKSADDWIVSRTVVEDGASIGANATIVCGVTIGQWAMVGAGAIVTKNVPDYALVVGSPARRIGWVCACGGKKDSQEQARKCPGCESDKEKTKR